jgi:hypothetical protein
MIGLVTVSLVPSMIAFSRIETPDNSMKGCLPTETVWRCHDGVCAEVKAFLPGEEFYDDARPPCGGLCRCQMVDSGGMEMVPVRYNLCWLDRRYADII